MKSVLVIDDEPSIRELVKDCLSDLAGWQVATAASAQEGLMQIKHDRPDAILLDILMPGMDAITFLQRLHHQSAIAQIPVVLLSVQANCFTSKQLALMGVADAISKPFNPLQLPDLIAQALGWKYDF